MAAVWGAATEKLQSIPVGSFVHASRLPGSAAASSSALKRARERGELVRVAKGVYWKGKRTRYGMALPASTDIAFAVLGTRGVGPAGFTAARWFGLTTQVPSRPTLAVTGSSPRRLPVAVTSRANMQRTSLTPGEIAALELLRGGWETTVDGGWPALSRALAQAVTSGKLRWAKLVKVAEGERSPALRANLNRLSDEWAASGIHD
ncbi:DUF6088 family protein [Nocardia sp. X0981]